ncbi:MAG: SAM-dependent methyltransferase [Methyloceanibacter sp.]|jgi:methyltransferase (TIGR00027 family)
MTQAIQNVSDTAFMVAGFRALETERPQPLFRNPLAAKLAGDHGRKILATVPRTFVGAWSVVIRTVIIDDLIKQAISEGVDTILNLGAGLDTRPYRMALPKPLRWVEVDYPHVIELKEARLADEEPRCRLDRIKLDLTDRLSRRKFLADMSARAKKILVLTEGVVPYLTDVDVAKLADDLKDAEKVRFWIIDYFSPEAIRYGKKMRARFMRNAPFRFAPKDWFGFFDQHGWRARDVRYISEEAERLGRPIPLPFLLKLWVRLAGAFIPRARRERMKRFAAYVLLIPK